MTDRSFAQIRWQQDRLGLLMVNERRQRFFVFAEKLIAMFNDLGRCKEIKLRDRKPARASGHYAGQVLGAMSVTENLYQIVLYIGYPLGNIDFDPQTELVPLEYLTSMEFIFPCQELDALKFSLETMLNQAVRFNEFLIAAEATPRVTQRLI